MIEKHGNAEAKKFSLRCAYRLQTTKTTNTKSLTTDHLHRGLFPHGSPFDFMSYAMDSDEWFVFFRLRHFRVDDRIAPFVFRRHDLRFRRDAAERVSRRRRRRLHRRHGVFRLSRDAILGLSTTLSTVERHLLFSRQIRDELLMVFGVGVDADIDAKLWRRVLGGPAAIRRAPFGNGAGMSQRAFDGDYGVVGIGEYRLSIVALFVRRRLNVHRIAGTLFSLEGQTLGL